MNKSKEEVDVFFWGDSPTSALLYSLLNHQEHDIVFMSIDDQQKEGYGDITLDGQCYNLFIMGFQDVDGIIDYYADKTNIKFSIGGYFLKRFQQDLCCIDGTLYPRPLSYQKWQQALSTLHPTYKTQLHNFFTSMELLCAENWRSLQQHKISPKDVPMFLELYKYTYTEYLKKFDFPAEVTSILLSYAPISKCSVITQAGYIGQIQSISPLHNGLKPLLNKVIGNFKQIEIPTQELLSIEHRPDGRLCINFSSGDSIICKKMIISKPYLLSKLLPHTNIKLPKPKGSGLVAFVRLQQPLQNIIGGDESYCIRFLFTIAGEDILMTIGHLDKKLVQIQIIGVGLMDNLKQLQEYSLLQLRDLGVTSDICWNYTYTPDELQEISGFYQGNMNSWAHSTAEIARNPLTDFEVLPNIVDLSKWANGYFYGASVCARWLTNEIKQGE